MAEQVLSHQNIFSDCSSQLTPRRLGRTAKRWQTNNKQNQEGYQNTTKIVVASFQDILDLLPSRIKEDWKSSPLFLPFQPCNAQRQHSQYLPSTTSKHFGKMILSVESGGNYGRQTGNKLPVERITNLKSKVYKLKI